MLLEEAVVAWRETLDEVLSEGTPPLATLERLIEAAVALEFRNGSLRAVPPEEQEAWRGNERALRERLRQIGFFTDLSDAFNSQTLRPRYEVGANA